MRTIRDPESGKALRRRVVSRILSVFQKDAIFHQVIKPLREITHTDKLNITRSEVIVSCLMNLITAVGTQISPRRAQKGVCKTFFRTE